MWIVYPSSDQVILHIQSYSLQTEGYTQVAQYKDIRIITYLVLLYNSVSNEVRIP